MAFLDTLLSMPRCSGLTAAVDGHRLAVTVARVDAAGTGWSRSVWALDPAGGAPRRLTASRAGEQVAHFAPGGDLLFTSERPDPDADPADDQDQAPAALWRLPADGGEAALVAAPPGGVTALAVASHAGTVVVATPVHPGAESWKADAAFADRRRERNVTAQLYQDYPVRRWDRWLGPRRPRLVVLAADGAPTDLTPDAGAALEPCTFAVSPDGGTVVTTWTRHGDDPRQRRTDLVAIDVATRARRVLLGAPATDFSAPAFSPDGRRVVAVREAPSTPEEPGDHTLVLVDLEGGASGRVDGEDLLPGVDHWPVGPVFVDDTTIAYTADDHGHTRAFAVETHASGAVRVLTGGGCVTELATAGGRLFALRDAIDAPPRAEDLDADGGTPRALPTPGSGVDVPGRLERVEAVAGDGTAVGGWLVTPSAASERPVPLVVMLHGGPLSSWTGWHWRWNPHVLADEGWAVLLPDPGLSTGYGLDMVRRGWGRWGEEPYTDVLAITGAVAARPDIDAERMAAIGGSFGGYLANWIAGHTGRFRTVVTHASLWDLRGFHGTTDLGPEWERQMGDPYTEPERYEVQSPHRHLAAIRTPMLVIHGTNDFRVPLSEALMLWTGLRRHGVEAAFLHFPDEHHWVEKPANVELWYTTVTAWLAHHLEGRPFQPPELVAGPREPETRGVP